MTTALIRYGVVFVVFAIGTAQLIELLNTSVDPRFGSPAQLMVPAMIAAVVEGNLFASANRRKPLSSEAWGFAWLSTGVATLLNVGLAYYGASLAPEFGKLAIAPFPSKQFIILLGLYAGGYLICNRFFLSIGAGNKLSIMRSRGEIE